MPPVKLRSPVVDETAALTVRTSAAFSVTSPLPFAVTAFDKMIPPAVVLRLTLPLPAVVIVPAVVIAPPAVTAMSPLVVEDKGPMATPSVSDR